VPNVSPISVQENGFVHPGRAAFFFGGRTAGIMGLALVD
jgi:hypothetical protein